MFYYIKTGIPMVILLECAARCNRGIIAKPINHLELQYNGL